MHQVGTNCHSFKIQWPQCTSARSIKNKHSPGIVDMGRSTMQSTRGIRDMLRTAKSSDSGDLHAILAPNMDVECLKRGQI